MGVAVFRHLDVSTSSALPVVGKKKILKYDVGLLGLFFYVSLLLGAHVMLCIDADADVV